MPIIYLAVLASSVTVVSTSPQEPRKANVQYDDLNLASFAGRESLDQRLNLALNMVCGRKAGYTTIQEQMAIRKCRRIARAKVAPQRHMTIAHSGMKIVGWF